MSKNQLTCIVCHNTLENIMKDKGFQPNNGLAFESYGHYGSTFFDPMDGSFIEICICDGCLTKNKNYINEVKFG